jgi:RNA 3'-terminal phosphate cyclase
MRRGFYPKGQGFVDLSVSPRYHLNDFTTVEELIAHLLNLGERGVRADKIGAMAARKLLKVVNSDAAVDHHLADNLIPLLALVGGTIKTDKITGHIRSNIYVCEQFLDVAFSIDENQNRVDRWTNNFPVGTGDWM